MNLKAVLAASLILMTYILGCGAEKECEITDTTPPATPRGVRTITGDGRITIEWFGSDEPDLAGYRVYRSEDGVHFDLIAEIRSPQNTRYVDEDVQNGRTYYYAVSSFDFEGNESDLSPEEVWDTPRPEGRVTLEEYEISPDYSGFDFSKPEQGPIPFDTPSTDIYFDADDGVFYFLSDNGTLMQDVGYHASLDEVDIAPEAGYVGDIIEVIQGHVYVFYTPEGNYAKARIVRVSNAAVTFEWAVQMEPDNPQFAPPRR